MRKEHSRNNSAALVAGSWIPLKGNTEQYLLALLQDKNPHQKEDVNYLMTVSTEHAASWSLRIDNVNPCDPTL